VFGLWLSPLFFYGCLPCFDNLIEMAALQENSQLQMANGIAVFISVLIFAQIKVGEVIKYLQSVVSI